MLCPQFSFVSVFFLSFYCLLTLFFLSFFFNDTAPTEIYTLSLHDALPILIPVYLRAEAYLGAKRGPQAAAEFQKLVEDRKSTRLNSSHPSISYAVFCLKKKKKKKNQTHTQK